VKIRNGPAAVTGKKVSALNHWYTVPGRRRESRIRESEDLPGQGAGDLEEWVGTKDSEIVWEIPG